MAGRSTQWFCHHQGILAILVLMSLLYLGFTKAVALETATTGVTANAICPGWVLTPLVQQQVDARAAKDGVDGEEAKRRLLAEKQPSLQFTTTTQLGELALFLCSAGADNIRGAAFNVDGGWAAQ